MAKLTYVPVIFLGEDTDKHRAHYKKLHRTVAEKYDAYPLQLLVAVVFTEASVTVFAAVPTPRTEARARARSVGGSGRLSDAERTLWREGLAPVKVVGGADADEHTNLADVAYALTSSAEAPDLGPEDVLRLAAVQWERACDGAAFAGVPPTLRELLGQQYTDVPVAVSVTADGSWIVGIGDQSVEGVDRESLNRFARSISSGVFPRRESVRSGDSRECWITIPSIEVGVAVSGIAQGASTEGGSVVGAIPR